MQLTHIRSRYPGAITRPMAVRNITERSKISYIGLLRHYRHICLYQYARFFVRWDNKNDTILTIVPLGGSKGGSFEPPFKMHYLGQINSR